MDIGIKHATLAGTAMFLACSVSTALLAACSSTAGPGQGDDDDCASGLVDCAGTCVDLGADSSNCGACGQVCGTGELCNGVGQCGTDCEVGFVMCDDTCINPNINNENCGSCGRTCGAEEICNGVGLCETSCEVGLVACDDTCIDPNTDNENCGVCGRVCVGDEICNGVGLCETICKVGLVACDDTCIDPDTDRDHCGASGDCQGASAGTVCDGGDVCDAGGCRSRAWGNPELVETNEAGDALPPSLALDPVSGDALAIWGMYDGTRYNVWANRHDRATSSWGSAQLLETSDAGNAYDSHVAFDANGNAVAIWRQNDGTRDNIWARRYDGASSSWGSAELIEANTDDSYNVRLAVSANGDAFAAWSSFDGTRFYFWTNRYDAATSSWGSAVVVGTTVSFSYMAVAVDASGNALASWSEQVSATSSSVHAARYDATSSSWGSAAVIGTRAGLAHLPELAFDASGNAFVVWSGHGTYVNRYDAATSSWGSAVLLGLGNTSISWLAQLAFDASGNALAAWSESDGTRDNLWANCYDAEASSWGTAELIETDNAGHAWEPQLAFDTSGHALAVWSQDDGSTRRNVWASRYDVATSSWETAELIETNTGGAYGPQVAFDSSGAALAVWLQHDGNRNSIYANRFE